MSKFTIYIIAAVHSSGDLCLGEFVSSTSTRFEVLKRFLSHLNKELSECLNKSAECESTHLPILLATSIGLEGPKV